MRVGLLGDVHANVEWMNFSLWAFWSEGITTIVQLGDFGVGFHKASSKELDKINSWLKKYGQTIYVVPGNHEDYDLINSMAVEKDGWQNLRSQIKLAPRGHRWEWDGTTFVALGGAPSVDRSARIKSKRKSWWAEEAITGHDVDKVKAGGYADVMVAHDAPNGVSTIAREIGHNPFGFKPWDLEYAREGRALMTEAFLAVNPKFFFHGHYHFLVDEEVPTTDGTCRVFGLSCDNRVDSLGVFDTTTKGLNLLDLSIYYLEWKALRDYR